MSDDDDPNRGVGPLLWFLGIVVLLLLVGLGFAAVRFYGLR